MLLQIVGTAGLVTAAGVSPAHAGTRARSFDAVALQAALEDIAATSAAGVLAETRDRCRPPGDSGPAASRSPSSPPSCCNSPASGA
jgi:hypothetical protein